MTDPHSLTLHFRGMADLEAHPQLIGTVIQQKDRQNAVVDHRPHQVCNPVHQRLQVERGVQRICKVLQEVDRQGFEPDVRFWRMRMEERAGRC